MTWSQPSAAVQASCEVGMVGEQAELRGAEKGMREIQKGEDRNGGVARDAEGAREEELSHLCPTRH